MAIGKFGVAGVAFTSADATTAASVTDAPTSGKKLTILELFVSVDTAMTVTFKEETSGTVVAGPFYMAANTSLSRKYDIFDRKLHLPVADKKLQVIASVSGKIMVEARYMSE